MFPWSKKPNEKVEPATPPAPKDESQKREATGIIMRRAHILSAGYSYYHLAILVPGEGSDGDIVLRSHQSGGSSSDHALCQKGDRVAVQLQRSSPTHDWYLTSLKIVFDIAKERAAAAVVPAAG